jgi:hypothetical protein
VSLTCSVTSDGSGFDIQLSAEQLGTGGGSIAIASTGQGTVTTSGATVSATFNNPMVGTYRQSDCTLSYTYNGSPVPTTAGPPVAGGRIWAHIDCPNAQDKAMTDPNGNPITCHASADFLFENCSGS